MAITIKNLDKLITKLDNISSVDTEKYVKNATTFVHGQAKLLAPADNGRLKGSIHMEVKTEEKKIIGRVYTNVNYAPYVEFGTGVRGNGTYPYKVKDLNLSYRDTPWVYTPDGGKTFYHTNGQVAQPFMYPALKGAESYVKNLINEGIKKEINKIARGGK